MSDRLADKTALITNLPVEVIPALAARLAGEGARVIVAAAGEQLAATQTQIVEHPGTDPSAWQELGEQIVRDCGRLDVLVQGLTGHHPATIVATSLQQFRAINEQNLEATFLATQAAFLAMAETGGCIVNVSSTWAAAGSPSAAAFCAGAGGLKMLTKSAGIEGVAGDNKIRVNCILAGDIEGLVVPENVHPAPCGEAIGIEALLDAVVFLASDGSAYMTGAMLPLDGGLAAG
jgi:NAD(P)-dependent dehydrogenase (short-subunit alcohol dehydrogenase family)